MTDMPETFEMFLRIWITENIGFLGSQIDATNLKYFARKGRRIGEGDHERRTC
jgi:hypothetical protein